MELNLTSTAVEKSIEGLRSFLGKLIGPATSELGQTLGDHVKWWRTRHQIDLLARVKDYTDKHNIPLRHIGLKTLLPLLDHSSLEEEPLLQRNWENLLINSIDARKPQTKSIFPFILSQISSNEAQALISLRGKGIKSDYFTSLSEQLGVDDIEFANLKRLGVVEELPNYSGRVYNMEYGRKFDFDADGRTIQLTALGQAFLDAVELNQTDAI